MLIPAALSQFRLTPVNNTIGIFYHEEKTIRISNDRWTLLVYKEIRPFRETIKNNEKILSSLYDLLEDSSPRTAAFKASVQTHFSLLTRIAESVNLKLFELTADTKKYAFRYKRGLINGIGSIFKFITGNLDSSDGEYFDACINKVSHDERELETLLKSQISITSSVIKSFNTTLQKLSIDEATFNEDMEKIKKLLADI